MHIHVHPYMYNVYTCTFCGVYTCTCSHFLNMVAYKCSSLIVLVFYIQFVECVGQCNMKGAFVWVEFPSYSLRKFGNFLNVQLTVALLW